MLDHAGNILGDAGLLVMVISRKRDVNYELLRQSDVLERRVHNDLDALDRFTPEPRRRR